MFWRVENLFPKALHPFFIPTSSVWEFLILPVLVMDCLFNNHLNSVLSGISLQFWFGFPWWLMTLSECVCVHSVRDLTAHLYIFGEMSVQIRFVHFRCPVFHWLICLFIIELQEFKNFLVSHICDLQMFSPTLWVLFSVFWQCPFCKVMMKSKLSVLLLLLMLLLLSKNSLPNSRFTPMLSSKSFMFLVLMFRLSINSKLIFVYGVKQWPKFILLHMVIQLSQHYVLKTYIFLFHWMFFVPLLKISWLLDFISGF